LDAKGETIPEQQAYLRQPENLRAWQMALQEARADLERQFTSRRHKMNELRDYCFSLPEEEGRALFREGVREYRRWKDAAGQYLSALEQSQAEAKQLIRQYHDTVEEQRRKLGYWLGRDLRDFLADDDNHSVRESTLTE
jgi:hypothetical protein